MVTEGIKEQLLTCLMRPERNCELELRNLLYFNCCNYQISELLTGGINFSVCCIGILHMRQFKAANS